MILWGHASKRGYLNEGIENIKVRYWWSAAVVDFTRHNVRCFFTLCCEQVYKMAEVSCKAICRVLLPILRDMLFLYRRKHFSRKSHSQYRKDQMFLTVSEHPSPDQFYGWDRSGEQLFLQ